MTEPAPLTMRELRGLTPRQLEILCNERGIEVPPRTESAQMRQALAGRGGTLTTADVPVRGQVEVAEGARGAVEAALQKLSVGDLEKVADDHELDVRRADGSEGKPRKDDYVAAILGGRSTADASQLPAGGAGAGNYGPEPSDAAKAAIEEGAQDVRPQPIPGEPPGEPATAPATAVEAVPTPGGEPVEGDGLDDPSVTKADLRELAQRNEVEFRSRDTVDELKAKLRDANVRRS